MIIFIAVVKWKEHTASASIQHWSNSTWCGRVVRGNLISSMAVSVINNKQHCDYRKAVVLATFNFRELKEAIGKRRPNASCEMCKGWKLLCCRRVFWPMVLPRTHKELVYPIKLSACCAFHHKYFVSYFLCFMLEMIEHDSSNKTLPQQDLGEVRQRDKSKIEVNLIS